MQYLFEKNLRFGKKDISIGLLQAKKDAFWDFESWGLDKISFFVVYCI